ncbi:MAG TPA: lamin tail domain-containing protein, partial [Myxococcota bacterium]|nr:lamin tail domain-containing protein [Myxococcota bacterium]
GDAAGEWIELYNPTTAPVDLAGWFIAEDGPGVHQIVGQLVIPSGGYLVLCSNANQSTNGGVTCAYQLTNFALINGGDSVLLLDPDGVEVDRVVYGPMQGYTTSAPAGAAIGLRHYSLENEALFFPEFPADPAEWGDLDFVVASTVFGSGDKGTPGAQNDGYREQNHPTCQDGNVCTYDACSVGVCENPRVPGCCLVNADCNDSEVCTQDFCNVNTLTCTNTEIDGCCHDVSDCIDENPCNADYCTNNRCVYSAYNINPGCCYAPASVNPVTGLPWASEIERAAFANAQCDDKKYCTPDFCDLSSNLCSAGEPVENCCNLNAECDDGDYCTYDSCWGHQCLHEKMRADCCTEDIQCDDGDVCTIDRCALNSCRHSWNTSDCCEDHPDCPDEGNPCTLERCVFEPISGRRVCTHPVNPNCKVDLPYIQPFDGTESFQEIGWTFQDFQTNAVSHWKLNGETDEL